MAKKYISWKTKGMNRDMSVSAFNPEFAFENVNLRLATNEGNTMMSWVNEKGTSPIFISQITQAWDNVNISSEGIKGTVIGTAVLNHQLVLFTTTTGTSVTDVKPDRIYVFKYYNQAKTTMTGRLLYNGNLNLHVQYPLETMVAYEAKYIQKVYWTDNRNQPRLINIAATDSKIAKWNANPTVQNFFFDFVPSFTMRDSDVVIKQNSSSGGLFAPGVIQYAFTYINKYGQESNIAYLSTLYYLAHSDRGASPEEKVSTSFAIKINNPDYNFDYIRLYSIQRTSLNSEPLVKKLDDIPLTRRVEGSSAKANNAKGILAQSSSSNLDDFGKTMTASMIAKFSQITNLSNAFYVQGAACYGKYLFQAYIAGKYIDVINLETNERVATLETDIAYSFMAYHGNVLSFGKSPAGGSDFPYLYYSCENNGTPCILVIRISNSSGSWSGDVVQRIYLPNSKGGTSQSNNSTGSSSTFTHYYQNGCVDAENGYIWVSGYTKESYFNNSGDYADNQLVYRKYNLPSATSGNVYYSSLDVLETFTLPFKKSTQGMVIKDNKLYQCFGYDQNDTYDEFLDCIDLGSKSIVHSYQFPKEQLKDLGEELESPYIYDGNLYLSATCYNWRYYTLWKLTFSSDGGSGGGDDGGGGVIIPPYNPNPGGGDDDSDDAMVYDIVYVDNGTNGSTIDPTELLYIGGKEIKALTMADKDNTLFIGNITEKNSLVTSIQDYYDELREGNPDSSMGISFKADAKKQLTLDHTTGIYSHTNMLNHSLREMSTFKGGETYRFGFQLQKRTGEWSEPIFMNDVLNPVYPSTSIASDNINLVYAEADIALSTLASKYNQSGEDDFYSIYKKIRPVVVYPSIGDRSVLCQGVLNPTVFNAMDRIDNSPFAQASWFFRPYIVNSEEKTSATEDYTQYFSVSSQLITRSTDADGIVDNAVNSYLSNNGLLQEIYILVADVDSSYIDGVLSNGYLRYHNIVENKYTKGDWDSSSKSEGDVNKAFLGAISLGGTKYVFLSTTAFVKEGSYSESKETTTGATIVTSGSAHYLDGVTNVWAEGRTFSFYKSMKVSDNHIPYYERVENSSMPNPYTFKFYAGNYLYTVSFTAVAADTSYIIKRGDDSGDILRYKHYDSLFTLDDMASTTLRKETKPVDAARQLEIEGAIKNYVSPYSSYKEGTSSNGTGFGNRFNTKNAESNTQFFIDQSIVTLNSPDIEFDTDVQTYGMEGLKMRIVGAIPITANASAHSIKTSSNMLESYHNTDAKGTGFGGKDNVRPFGSGERNYNVLHSNISPNGGRRLISEYLWNDVVVNADAKQDDGVTTGSCQNYLVYPWQRTGSLNNDTREKEATTDKGTIYASSYLQTKKESHILYSINSAYLDSMPTFEYISSQIHLTENDEVVNMRLPRQSGGSSEINYYPNIDKVLTNGEGYKVLVDYGSDTTLTDNWSLITRPVSMKYKSTSHAVIALRAGSSTSTVPILPYGVISGSNIGRSNYLGMTSQTFWNDEIGFNQGSIDLTSMLQVQGKSLDFLWLAELYKDADSSSRFGGKGRTAVMGNKWLVAGEAKSFSSSDSSVTLDWTDGDTYYQRYDCLKTYPFTNDDVNQITEILSFMCETHVNIDGRYDRNRGQIRNFTMRPENFNKLNPVYSQQNNFFTSRKLDVSDVSELSYPNHIYYSKTKESGADIDLWTNVTLATTLELDGDKGQITSLNRLNDQLIAFQDSGISQVLYNENVQISSTSGVPIEIANSGKVQGKRYISDTIGCSNKWSITQTPMGIYFIDNNDKSIYLFNGQLGNISTSGGFNSWAKQSIPSADVWWNPASYGNFRAVYDKLNQDVLFIDGERALAYSEKFGCFTSFYDYGHAPYFENFDDTGIWVKDGKLYKHQAGSYGNFFGTKKPFSMTLVANQEPQLDKMFTNLEFRACVTGEGTEIGDKFTPLLPFDSLEAWNEYQHGVLSLENKNGHSMFVHGKDDGFLSRKFRMWRCDIPRNNVGTTGFKARPLDRIRNPWAYLKLTKNAASDGNLSKVEIHDIMATYFG